MKKGKHLTLVGAQPEKDILTSAERAAFEDSWTAYKTHRLAAGVKPDTLVGMRKVLDAVTRYVGLPLSAP